MKKTIVFLGTFLMMTACATLQDNQVLTEIALGQTVARVIQNSDSPMDRARRCMLLADAIDKYLESGAVLSASTITDAVKGHLAARSLSPADKLLLNDLLLLAEKGLKDIEIKKLPELESVAFVKSLTERIRSTAQLYL